MYFTECIFPGMNKNTYLRIHCVKNVREEKSLLNNVLLALEKV